MVTHLHAGLTNEHSFALAVCHLPESVRVSGSCASSVPIVTPTETLATHVLRACTCVRSGLHSRKLEALHKHAVFINPCLLTSERGIHHQHAIVQLVVCALTCTKMLS